MPGMITKKSINNIDFGFSISFTYNGVEKMTKTICATIWTVTMKNSLQKEKKKHLMTIKSKRIILIK